MQEQTGIDGLLAAIDNQDGEGAFRRAEAMLLALPPLVAIKACTTDLAACIARLRAIELAEAEAGPDSEVRSNLSAGIMIALVAFTKLAEMAMAAHANRVPAPQFGQYM